MRRSPFLVLWFLAAAIACAANSPTPLQPVSLVQLIVTPERFTDTRVMVSGFALSTGTGLVLFNTEKDRERRDWAAGVGVALAGEFDDWASCHQQYVRVVGGLVSEDETRRHPARLGAAEAVLVFKAEPVDFEAMKVNESLVVTEPCWHARTIHAATGSAQQ